ncbi:uncharacterized protein LOC131025830 [Salvia miltiorrhiza]|uniref:uncharacterized protein LOC131025830 n=1 Tax=Salvia miltiorrhiza TaxID=226208 RepID=UPI0025ABE1B0|nr:uncharacterized protein LOC131025830 [Salvia miltiorrhiza]
MGIARYVGHPLRVDGTSAKRDFGQFARILIEIDMSKPLPNTLLVDGDDVAFHVEFTYKYLPFFVPDAKQQDILSRNEPLDQSVDHVDLDKGSGFAIHETNLHERDISRSAESLRTPTRTDTVNGLEVLKKVNAMEIHCQDKVSPTAGRSTTSALEISKLNLGNRFEVLTSRGEQIDTEAYKQPVNLPDQEIETSEDEEEVDAEIIMESDGKFNEEDMEVPGLINERRILEATGAEAVAIENAMKAQRLEQILAIAKAPMKMGSPPKKRGRPSKQALAAKAAKVDDNKVVELNTAAHESIKNHLRHSTDTGYKARDFVI